MSHIPPHSDKLHVNLSWYYALCLQELNHILHNHTHPTFSHAVIAIASHAYTSTVLTDI
jgi:hypothetical protein